MGTVDGRDGLSRAGPGPKVERSDNISSKPSGGGQDRQDKWQHDSQLCVRSVTVLTLCRVVLPLRAVTARIATRLTIAVSYLKFSP